MAEKGKARQWGRREEAADGGRTSGRRRRGTTRRRDGETKTVVRSAVEAQAEPDDDARTAFRKRMRSFTIPALGIYVSGPLLSLVDTAIVGLQSRTELAALGPATVLCDVSLFFFNALATAATSLVAASLVEGDRRATANLVLCGVQIGAVLGTLLMAVLLLYPRALLAFMGAPLETFEPALSYTAVRALSVPFQVVAVVCSSCCLGKGDAFGPLRATAVAAAVNLVGDAVLCLGPPQMGIRGAAIATTTAVVVQCVLLLRQTYAAYLFPFEWYVKDVRERVRAIAASVFVRPSRGIVGAFLTYMGPLSFILLTRVAGFSLSAACAAAYGTTVLASHQVLFSVFNLLIVFGQPISQTAMTFLPAAIGAARAEATAEERNRLLNETGDPDGPRKAAAMGLEVQVPDYDIPLSIMNDKPRKTTEQLASLSVVVGLFLAVLAAIFIVGFPRIFTDDTAVIALIRQTAPVVCIGLAVLPMNIVMDGVFVALGKLKTVMAFTTVTLGVQVFWLFFNFKVQQGLPGVWIAQLWRLVVFNLLALFVLFRYGIIGRRNPAKQRAREEKARALKKEKARELAEKRGMKRLSLMTDSEKETLRGESERRIAQEFADEYRRSQGLAGELPEDHPATEELNRLSELDRDGGAGGEVRRRGGPPSV